MEKDLIERFKKLPLGNICDANGKKGNMDSGIRPNSLDLKIVGEAFTVQCYPKDNLTIHKAVYEAPAGSILVVDTQGYYNCGYFGDILGLACQLRGIIGLVIDGGYRDSEDLNQIGFPVFGRTINSGGTVKATVGKVGMPIICGGVSVSSRDLIVADADGVVVIEQDKIMRVLENAELIARSEINARARLNEGLRTIEILGLDKCL